MALISFAFPWTFGRMIGSMRQATVVVVVATGTPFVRSTVAAVALGTDGNVKLA